ncbi:MAG: hypothetical protein HRU11_06285 [Parvularculaceae bacterium]|nr:hypothetical protein [Parvularculaceae bacterium]
MIKSFLAAGAAVVALSLTPAHADHRSGWDVDIFLAGGGGWVDTGFATWRQPYTGRHGRYYGRRGVRSEICVTRNGFIELVSYRRGRIIDVDRIGRVDRHGRWNYYDGFRRSHWRGWEDSYYGYWRDQRRWDRYDRRYDRYADRRDRRWDDRRDRRDDRRDDRNDRRDRRDDRNTDGRDRRRWEYRDSSNPNANTYGIQGRVMVDPVAKP